MSLDRSTPRVAAELTRLEMVPEAAIAALGSLDITRGRVTVVTGAPGSGKSSLIHRLVIALAKRGEHVGAILMDPSSPVTGGAVLGDRLRMLEAERYPGVFIRSVAARSGVEGIGTVAPVMAWTLLNRGFDHVFLESVGIGQQELDVARRGEVLMLVLGPDSGDWVQFIKSGVLDLCDLIAVTKADLDTRKMVAEVTASVRLQSFRRVPVPVEVVSNHSGQGIAEIVRTLDAAHALTTDRKAELRSAVVQDILLRTVLEETRRRIERVLEKTSALDWRVGVQRAKAFIDALPAGEAS